MRTDAHGGTAEEPRAGGGPGRARGSGRRGGTLLREAIESTLDYEQRWSAYAEAEHEPTVLPILVVQVPDKSSEAKSARSSA